MAMEIEKRRNTEDGFEKLVRMTLEEVKFAIENQLKEGDAIEANEEKLALAPVTNLVAESNFSKCDKMTRAHGGVMTLPSYCARNLVTTNKIFENEAYESLTNYDKQNLWREMRSSDAAKATKQMWTRLEEDVKAQKELSNQARAEGKLHKNQRIMKLVLECKKHGGPIDDSELDLLDKLNYNQVVTETKLLKATKFPDLKMRYRVRTGDNKFKFQKIDLVALKSNIRVLLSPESEPTSDLMVLLAEKLD